MNLTALSTPKLIEACIERLDDTYLDYPNAWELLAVAVAIADWGYKRFLDNNLTVVQQENMFAYRKDRMFTMHKHGMKKASK